MAPLGECFTPEVAQRVVELRASSALDARLQELGARHSEGRLARDEVAEYETLVRFVKFVSVLQSKARRQLRSADAE
jgi:hypothetical protein